MPPSNTIIWQKARVWEDIQVRPDIAQICKTVDATRQHMGWGDAIRKCNIWFDEINKFCTQCGGYITNKKYSNDNIKGPIVVK